MDRTAKVTETLTQIPPHAAKMRVNNLTVAHISRFYLIKILGYLNNMLGKMDKILKIQTNTIPMKLN